MWGRKGRAVQKRKICDFTYVIQVFSSIYIVVVMETLTIYLTERTII